jgi:hypothetical protein
MATDINILIKATDQASPAIKKVEGELKDVGTQAKNSSSMMSGFGNVLKAGLTTALVGTAAAVGGMVFAFKDSLSAAKESIEANKQLEQVIKSTGGAAGVTADQARELAGSLANVTNFQDDAIVSGENLLLTFTGIGQDVFPRATETMLDMSQALGQDLSSSAVQLGKALNDPINGMTALSRVGVSFTDQQKEMITTMQNANDIAGAQGVILDELSKEFGGSAKALADPATQLANAWGEVQEAVGMGLMPVLASLAQTALPYVQAAANAVSTAVQNFYKYLGDGMPVLEAVQQAIADVLPDDWKAKWDDFANGIQGTLNTVTGTIQNTMGWIRLAWDTDWGGIHTTWTEFAADLPNEQATFWAEWQKTFNTGSKQNAVDWETYLGGLGTFAAGWWRLTVANWTLSLALIRGEWQTFSSLFKGDWEGTWNGFKEALFAVTDIILNYIEFVFGPNLRDKFAGALNGVWDTLKSWWENVQSWWNSTVGALFGMMAPASLPTPNFAIVNSANTSGGGGTTNNTTVHVNVNGGSDPYQTGQQVGAGVSQELRARGH